MDSIRKNIDEELALNILGKSSLPGRSMCSKLEAVYSDGTCPNVYAITDKQIGEKSAFGKVYETCCDNNCEYVAKWQPKIEPALREARIQYEVAQEGLAPVIHDVWECDKGVIIIMDSLETTVLKELESLSDEQDKTVIILEEPKFKATCTEVFVALRNNNFKRIESLKGLKEFRLWRKMINSKIKENRLDIRPIPEVLYEVTKPDDIDQMNYKSNLLLEAVSLLERLHNLGYYHGDAHLNNFMRDKHGEYKLIDFGMSGSIHSNDELIYDYFKLALSLDKLIAARRLRTHPEDLETVSQLDYLGHVFREIPIIQLNLNALEKMYAKYEEYEKKM